MEFRRALEKDFEQMVALQTENLVTSISQEERQDGFLSVSFNEEQFAQFNRDLAVIVAAEKDAVCAYLVTSTQQANLAIPLPAAMMARYSCARFNGQPLDRYTSLVAGPVCVARAQRGKGVFEGLYGALPDLLPRAYDLAVALVSIDNPRSVRAHEKVGLVKVDQFQFGGREFFTLAKSLAPLTVQAKDG